MANHTFLQTAWSQFGASAVFIIGLYAVFAGSWRERLCGGAYIVAYVAQLCFSFMADRSPIAYTFALDLLCLPIFMIANRKSPHPWFWLAIAGQIESLLTALVVVLIAGISNWIYLVAEMIGGYMVLLAILAGTISTQIRRRREKSATLPSPQDS